MIDYLVLREGLGGGGVTRSMLKKQSQEPTQERPSRGVCTQGLNPAGSPLEETFPECPKSA